MAPGVRAALIALFTCAVAAAPARAGEVLVLEDDGDVRSQAVRGVDSRGERVPPIRVAGPTALASRSRTVPGELRRMLRAGAITPDEHDVHRRDYESAKRLVRRLPAGRRRIEMGAAVALLERMAARGTLTVSRLNALWLTLERNRDWWTKGPLLSSGQRVSFAGSEVVWQYVPGQGLHLHPLANFGKLNGLWSGKRFDRRLEVLLDELIDVVAERGGGLAWEYYFDYGGGRAPWVSAMAQGTAMQALSRAGIRLQRKEEVLPIAKEALKIFQLPPPVGVRVNVGDGAHYLLYSFNRRLRVLNGFIQALVGLNDFAIYANDDEAREVFAAGDRQARRELPSYDTGHWSLYSRIASTREASLSYHRLVIGFLDRLCERSEILRYCEARDRFEGYLREPPQLELITRRLPGGRTGLVRFGLSKISTVSIRVSRGGRAMLARSALAGRGERSFAWWVPRRPGEYAVTLSAVDLAGNRRDVRATVEVLRPRRARKRRDAP